ncbi:carbonic anhydrase 2 isoform X2 [Formica exsecta]|uniref:carbonic anhydrase 2 isoform X2 n=1 Tax=Formica exsecta TaxID=72781 RepID=UPI0011450898|nr:carbonic anhydrase 2 isoform X2 [Formica exsecta]
MGSKDEWDYSIQNGPSTWVTKFPMAAGSRQSPVNIETKRAESDHEALSSKPLRWKYPATASRKLVNPGYCWRVDAAGEGTFLSGGPLMDDVYKLEQYHCHWGCSDSRGSEHTVDGQAFAGELHLVHWNTSKYKTFGEAAKASDGLAVLGVFLKVGKTHEEMDKIARLLPYVSHKDEVVEITEPIDPGKLLPVRGGRAGTQRCVNPCMRWADRIIPRHENKWDFQGSYRLGEREREREGELIQEKEMLRVPLASFRSIASWKKLYYFQATDFPKPCMSTHHRRMDAC